MMRIKLLDGAVAPKRMTTNSAGYDLCAYETVWIPPGTHCKVRTGVHMEIPPNQVGTISHRSGMNSKQGVQAYGRVDSDYRGEVSVTIFNADPSKPLKIEDGARIAQIVFLNYNVHTFQVVDELVDTERGEGGHGSTGA